MQVTATSDAPVSRLAADGHVAVFGAPGSGKTTFAVELVADRIERLGHATDEVRS